MKKVLVTGAAGSIGINVLKNLVLEDYKITALDLKNIKNMQKLARYKKQVNIVYGDVNDRLLIDALIRDHDYVIHLAGVIIPFANLKGELCKLVDYDGTCNIVNAINSFNPKCYLFYASSTSIYEDKKTVQIDTPVNIANDDYYSFYKYEAEKVIIKALKNYTIFRLPIVMGKPNDDAPIFNVPRDKTIEMISNVDAGYAFAEAIKQSTKLNKKIFNLAGGPKNRVVFRDYLIKFLTIYGLTWRYLITLILIEQNYVCHNYADAHELEKILKFRSEGQEDYYLRLSEYGQRRYLARLLAKPFIWLLNRKR